MAKNLKPKELTEMLERHIVSKKYPRLWQGIPTIERTPGGRLWCSFFSGGQREPEPGNFILITDSVDDGATWSEPCAIIHMHDKTRAYDPYLWMDPYGNLWLFYNLANKNEMSFSVWAIKTCNPDSPEPAWSTPAKVGFDVPFSFRLNKLIVLSTGEWILPVTWAKTTKHEHWWFPVKDQLQGVAISSDKGGSWKLHGEVKAPEWALENMIVELSDGRLWMLIRTNSGFIWESFSNDAGKNWSKANATEIVNPGVRFFIGRLKSGRILLINTPDPKERKTLCARLSDSGNEMKFSSPGLILDERDKVSYPDAVQSSDGRIFCVNDFERHGPGEIVLSIFSEKDMS